MITLWEIAHIKPNSRRPSEGSNEWTDQGRKTNQNMRQVCYQFSCNQCTAGDYFIVPVSRFFSRLHRSVPVASPRSILNDHDEPRTEDSTQEPFDCKNRLVNLYLTPVLIGIRIISNLSRSIILFWRNCEKKIREAAHLIFSRIFLRSIRQRKAKNENFRLFLLCILPANWHAITVTPTNDSKDHRSTIQETIDNNPRLSYCFFVVVLTSGEEDFIVPTITTYFY